MLRIDIIFNTVIHRSLSEQFASLGVVNAWDALSDAPRRFEYSVQFIRIDVMHGCMIYLTGRILEFFTPVCLQSIMWSVQVQHS